ncbi:hypothetical protein SAMN05444373_100656 [Thermoclostridium caenicola]|uniref:Uncharacterized protein n=1 Tax=Thermoclostridium caenicola TaxID=659425 RepID=A0A1M6D111_9FIRM|nr:hypothetical protein SAMN05444373_100656 [Thermoclostridium caenicola]
MQKETKSNSGWKPYDPHNHSIGFDAGMERIRLSQALDLCVSWFFCSFYKGGLDNK